MAFGGGVDLTHGFLGFFFFFLNILFPSIIIL